ncbi:hypothetical protein HN51_030677 [Arachis hypogaea]
MISSSCFRSLVRLNRLVKFVDLLGLVCVASYPMQACSDQRCVESCRSFSLRPRACNALLHALVNTHRFDSLWEVYGDMVLRGFSPTVVSYGILMQCCCSQADSVGVRKLFDEMRHRKIKPTVVVYTIMIRVLFNEGRIGDAEGVFRLMRKSGVVPNLYTYKTLMDSSGKIANVIRVSNCKSSNQELKNLYIVRYLISKPASLTCAMASFVPSDMVSTNHNNGGVLVVAINNKEEKEQQQQIMSEEKEEEEEKKIDYSQRAQWLRAGVMGATDGLVSVASLMMGVGAVRTDAKAMLLAGFAGSVAGGCSMAIGEFVSVYTQYEVEVAQIKNKTICEDVQMVKKALPNPLQAALASASCYCLGAVPPLVGAAFIRDYRTRIMVVLAVATLSLFVFGWIGSVLGNTPMLRSCARLLLGGWMAMAITFALTKLFAFTGLQF